MMRQASGESDVSGTDLDEAIQAKHGHGPHRHSPHRHNPHRHTPYPTPFPTRYPTAYPTPYPTTHPCISGLHNCDVHHGECQEKGIGYYCTCKQTHWCSQGCSWHGNPLENHRGHKCTLITSAPTP